MLPRITKCWYTKHYTHIENKFYFEILHATSCYQKPIKIVSFLNDSSVRLINLGDIGTNIKNKWIRYTIIVNARFSNVQYTITNSLQMNARQLALPLEHSLVPSNKDRHRHSTKDRGKTRHIANYRGRKVSNDLPFTG